MDQHTVFGSGAPAYTLSVYNDGSPNITLGNYFYTYGSMASGWSCVGGRVYIPNNAGVTGKTITISVWQSTTPLDLSIPPLASGSVVTPVSGGWAEVQWSTPIAMTPGTFIFIGYAFASPSQAYYLHAPSPTNSFIRSIDNVDLVLSEATYPETIGQRGRFRIGTGATGSTDAWYGTDIIVAPTTSKPIAEYGFNETTGSTAADTSGNGHDLTLLSSANLNVGATGNGLHQVGGGGSYRISNTAPWLNTSKRSMMFWGRRGSEGADTLSQSVYQLDGTGNITFGINISDGTNVVFSVRQGGAQVTLTAAEVSIGTWVHYALTYDLQTIRAYINGVEVASQAATGAIAASDGNLYMFGGDYQQQVLDDLRLFDVAASAQQINTYMNDPVPAPDLEAPSVPDSLTASVIGQQVTLDWNNSTDNVAVQNYIVYRSATQGFTPVPADQVGGPSTSSYVETAPVGTWYYRVAARDEAGNISAPSSEIQVLTVASNNYHFPSDLGWNLTTTYNDNVANGYNFGVLFGLSSAAPIAGARFYSPVTRTDITVTLYVNGTQTVQKTGFSLVVGWNELFFDTAYIGTAGADYIIGVYLPGPTVSYRALPGQDWSGTSVGPMYTTNTSSSRFATGAGIPNVTSGTWYGVDAVVLSGTGGSIDTTFGLTIAAENAKEGSYGTEWTISGAGDTSNLGFARQFSVNAGETVDFSCHGSGTVIDIYRIGYYGGTGWRRVASLTNTATSQPTPNTIPDSNGGVECSNWSVTASWVVPSSALSGLFVGVYRNAAMDNASYIPFVVRNDARAADLAYKTSDSTWALAYNYYGTPAAPLTGKSLYGAGGPLGSISDRTHAVSYHRPIVTRAGVPQTYWLACEAPMIRFLERNGIDVKYVASRDIDAGVSVIANTSVALSSGHDEYWSDGMRDAFAAHRDNGNNLLFFSGNEVFWRTRFDASRNTMWCYKDTMQGPDAHVAGTPLDPVGWTGTWKDTRWVDRQPENTITGTDFRMNGVNDYAAMFQSSFGSHPFWRDTTLSSGNFTVNGIIGFEADEMLPTQPAGSYAVLVNHNFNIDGKRADDNGQEYAGNGNLNWGVVSQRYSSGAVVVGFGTCQWAWGLDATHDRGSDYTNANMQQATLNLLTDLGAAPTTTMSGLATPTAVSSLDVYGAVPSSGRSGKVKVWDGTQWNAHPAKVWDGSSWVTRKVKGHDGTGFIEGKG